MRIPSTFLFFFILISAEARSISADEIDPWKAHAGLMIGLNTSQVNVTGGLGRTITSGTQWSAGFGIYAKTAQVNMFRLELQLTYETTGGAKELFYERANQEWIRIYDRYRTIPLSLILLRNLGWKESWSVGIGFKSSFVVNYTVRHSGAEPAGMTGIIYSPEPRKWFGSPMIHIIHNFPNAEIALNGWYAVTPIIDQSGVSVVPYGISFAVKVRLFTTDN